MFYSKEMGIKIYQNQKDFLNVVRVYNQQVEVLVGIVGKSNRKQLKQLMPILKKLKSSCQKLVDQREQFKKCAFNLQKHKALLLPHINLLKETKAEIENVVKWFELKY